MSSNPTKPPNPDKPKNRPPLPVPVPEHPQQHTTPGPGAPVHNPQLLDSPFVPGDVVRCNGPGRGVAGLCQGRINDAVFSLGRDTYHYDILISPLKGNVVLKDNSNNTIQGCVEVEGTGYYFLHDPKRPPGETKLFCGPRDREGIQLLAQIAGVDNIKAAEIVALAIENGISVRAEQGLDNWGFGGPFRPPAGR